MAHLVFSGFDEPNYLKLHYNQFSDVDYAIDKHLLCNNKEQFLKGDYFYKHRTIIYDKDDNYNFEDTFLKYYELKKNGDSGGVELYQKIFILKNNIWYYCTFSDMVLSPVINYLNHQNLVIVLK